MQPYINPNYYAMNPYLSQNYMQNMQNMQMNQTQNPNQSTIVGRSVGDFGEINANDVPMDGRMAVFLKNDRSEIQIREWNPNGQIVSTSYLPQIEEKDTKTSISPQDSQKSKFDAKTEVLEPLFERLSRLEEKLDKMSKNSRTTKKDGEQE